MTIGFACKLAASTALILSAGLATATVAPAQDYHHQPHKTPDYHHQPHKTPDYHHQPHKRPDYHHQPNKMPIIRDHRDGAWHPRARP